MSDVVRIPFGEWVVAGVDLLTTRLRGLFDVIRAVFAFLYDWVEYALLAPPELVVLLVLVAIGFAAKGWRLAAGTAVGLLAIGAVDQWDNAMATLALVLVASAVAIALSVPLGILAARSDTASRFIRPVLDFMQTTPSFVYLIPALLLFRIGVVPGIVATIVFAMAPGVRLTELGIRGVDPEVVEAGHAFGSSRGRILRTIQLPLARPSIMAGVNQVIMLSLSMVVIAGLVGAGGLGGDVVASLSRLDVALGAEAGVSVVILAIILDRISGALGSPRRGSRPERRLRRRSDEAPDGPADADGRVADAPRPAPEPPAREPAGARS